MLRACFCQRISPPLWAPPPEHSSVAATGSAADAGCTTSVHRATTAVDVGRRDQRSVANRSVASICAIQAYRPIDGTPGVIREANIETKEPLAIRHSFVLHIIPHGRTVRAPAAVYRARRGRQVHGSRTLENVGGKRLIQRRSRVLGRPMTKSICIEGTSSNGACRYQERSRNVGRAGGHQFLTASTGPDGSFTCRAPAEAQVAAAKRRKDGAATAGEPSFDVKE